MALDSLRILEGKSLLWDDITRYYRSKIYNEDYIVMHGIHEEQLNRLINTKPFFSETYVLEIHVSGINNKIYNQLAKCLKSKWIVLIIVCSNRDDYDMVSNLCTKSFNGYKISFKYWNGYVNARLKCKTKMNLENAYKSLAGRFELTEVLIDMLNKSNGVCTLASFNKVIGKKDRMSIDLMWFSILRKDMRSKRDVFKYLEEYRYGYNFITTALINKYNEMLKLYDDFMSGKFNEVRLREYKKDEHLSGWILTTYLELFAEISYDEILLMGQMIECSNINSSAKMFELVGRLYSRLYKEVI